jgi:hypothetical protein
VTAASTGAAADELRRAPELHPEVERLIVDNGGRTVAVLDDDSAGDAWISWLYVVERDEPAGGAQE